jgi:hypothetical protein
MQDDRGVPTYGAVGVPTARTRPNACRTCDLVFDGPVGLAGHRRDGHGQTLRRVSAPPRIKVWRMPRGRVSNPLHAGMIGCNGHLVQIWTRCPAPPGSPRGEWYWLLYPGGPCVRGRVVDGTWVGRDRDDAWLPGDPGPLPAERARLAETEAYTCAVLLGRAQTARDGETGRRASYADGLTLETRCREASRDLDAARESARTWREIEQRWAGYLSAHAIEEEESG